MNEEADAILRHYGKELVKREIACFAAGRWVAVHCQTLDRNGKPYLIRYFRKARRKIPLRIDSSEDVEAIMENFWRLRPRTFYASINVYRRLDSAGDTRDLGNIAYCTPTWDVDNEFEKWKATVQVSKCILDFLAQHGVKQSVFLKWSGNGMHIHIHPKAFSAEVLGKIHPLDVAYSIVEYTNMKLHERYLEIASEHNAEKLRVENKIDIQRVFTCPLSLHRKLNLVAVCINPHELDDFSPGWASIESFRHWEGWNHYVEGEGDPLALEAYEQVGGYPMAGYPKALAKRRRRLDEMIMKWLRGEDV